MHFGIYYIYTPLFNFFFWSHLYFLPYLCGLLSRLPVIGFMRFWTCWDALDLDYRHEKRVIDLGHWLARYCILKIEYIIVSYIIILRYGSIGGGPENNIASTFANSPFRAGSCSCYIIFGPPGGASTFALRLMLLPPFQLPLWYADWETISYTL